MPSFYVDHCQLHEAFLLNLLISQVLVFYTYMYKKIIKEVCSSIQKPILDIILKVCFTSNHYRVTSPVCSWREEIIK